MLTIKQITENTEAVIRGLEKKHFKNAKETIDQVIALNDKRRTTQNQLDKNLAEVNSLSRTIGQLMKEGKKEEAESARARVAELKEGNTMKRQLRGTVAFAVCGSFCTLGAAVAQAEQLVRQGWELLPVMSYAASGLNTRFGRADEWKDRLETLTGHRVLDTLQDVEPLGPRQLARALVVAPCTGTTLARLAAGLSDTPVTLAAKSLLRVGCPVLLAVSTNDGLGASGENIARLMQRKHYYFVPYGQDDAAQKPQSLKADLTLLPAALEAALHGQQLQPVLREWN